MNYKTRTNDAVHRYWEECTSRIVAASGKPSDRFHFGKLIFQSLQDEPNFILQIDGGTGETETSGSVLKRSIKCAVSFQKLGLTLGDKIVFLAPNNIDLAIPTYAAMYLGIGISGLDRLLGVTEMSAQFKTTIPGAIFCLPEKANDVQKALDLIGHEALIITFGEVDNFISFQDFLKNYEDEEAERNFRPADFDPDTIAFLVSTSGSTGLPKCAVCTHKNFSFSLPYRWAYKTKFPYPTSKCLLVLPIHGITVLGNYLLSPVLRYTRLQTSSPLTNEHVYDLINTYKPTYMITSTTYLSSLMNGENNVRCDFSCFEEIVVSGTAVGKSLENMRLLVPGCDLMECFGMSELAGPATVPQNGPIGSCGRIIPSLQFKLVDTETREDIYEPHVPGELYCKGPSVFKGYYKNQNETKACLTDNGWFKTGDMFYMDTSLNMYFVERLKFTLKYKGFKVSSEEIENVIRQHPGVLDVGVSGVPDEECGDLPVAFIVKRSQFDVTADEIKTLVKESLMHTKQLRGGVRFIESMPMSLTGKINRMKIKAMAAELKAHQ